MVKSRNSYPRKDLTGKKFGMLTAIEWIRGGFWRCICDCGNETIVDARNLLSGHTESCGCKRYETKNVTDMSNYEDENLKVICRDGSVGGVATWRCICKHCGREFVTRGSNIRFGVCSVMWMPAFKKWKRNYKTFNREWHRFWNAVYISGFDRRRREAITFRFRNIRKWQIEKTYRISWETTFRMPKRILVKWVW